MMFCANEYREILLGCPKTWQNTILGYSSPFWIFSDLRTTKKEQLLVSKTHGRKYVDSLLLKCGNILISAVGIERQFQLKGKAEKYNPRTQTIVCFNFKTSWILNRPDRIGQTNDIYVLSKNKQTNKTSFLTLTLYLLSKSAFDLPYLNDFCAFNTKYRESKIRMHKYTIYLNLQIAFSSLKF